MIHLPAKVFRQKRGLEFGGANGSDAGEICPPAGTKKKDHESYEPAEIRHRIQTFSAIHSSVVLEERRATKALEQGKH